MRRYFQLSTNSNNEKKAKYKCYNYKISDINSYALSYYKKKFFLSNRCAKSIDIIFSQKHFINYS